MRYELSWQSDDGSRSFTTSCPAMAEVMMYSEADFEKRPAPMQEQFNRLYKNERGKFEKVLRDASSARIIGEIQTGIMGLVVRLVKNAGIEFC
jgi:hypothetical protein